MRWNLWARRKSKRCWKTHQRKLQRYSVFVLQLAKSSIKKYQAMENYAEMDGRARGLFQFYGAQRTGRWAGMWNSIAKSQRYDLPDLAEARELVKSGNGEGVELLYDSIPDTLSQLVRTALIPEPGKKFIVADFSAIEASSPGLPVRNGEWKLSHQAVTSIALRVQQYVSLQRSQTR